MKSIIAISFIVHIGLIVTRIITFSKLRYLSFFNFFNMIYIVFIEQKITSFIKFNKLLY